MSVRKGLLFGGAVAVVAASAGGIAYLLRDEDEGEEDLGGRTQKDPGRSKRPPRGKASKTKKPAPMPSSTSVNSDGVYRLTAEDLRDVTCTVRDAESARTVVKTLENVAAAVEQSEAQTVDLRSTGVVQEVMARDEAVAELRAYARDLEAMSVLLWGAVHAEIHKRLAALPACGAPLASWEAAATGASTKSRLMTAVAPSPAWGAFAPLHGRTT